MVVCSEISHDEPVYDMNRNKTQRARNIIIIWTHYGETATIIARVNSFFFFLINHVIVCKTFYVHIYMTLSQRCLSKVTLVLAGQIKLT
jgi:hypothetical protein